MVNCTLDSRRDRRFQPLWPPDQPSWMPRPPSGAGGRPPTSPRRPAKHLQGDNSAAFRLECPYPTRHTPATSKKQTPIGWSTKYLRSALTLRGYTGSSDWASAARINRVAARNAKPKCRLAGGLVEISAALPGGLVSPVGKSIAGNSPQFLGHVQSRSASDADEGQPMSAFDLDRRARALHPQLVHRPGVRSVQPRVRAPHQAFTGRTLQGPRSGRI